MHANPLETVALRGNVAVCGCIAGEAHVNQHLCFGSAQSNDINRAFLGYFLKSEVGQTRELARLRKAYGARRWRKRKAAATIELANGTIREAELHWYDRPGGAQDQTLSRLSRHE